jgi:hypothetical protein
LIRWFTQQEAEKYKMRSTPAISSIKAHASAEPTTSHEGRGRAASAGKKQRLRQAEAAAAKETEAWYWVTGSTFAALVSFLLCGAWVDDKVVVSVDEGLYDRIGSCRN